MIAFRAIGSECDPGSFRISEGVGFLPEDRTGLSKRVDFAVWIVT